MSKKTKFIEFVEENLFSKINLNEIDTEIVTYWEALKEVSDKEKPAFTDNGKMILQYLQSMPDDTTALKAKDIAEGMGVSSRTVSGAMKKLVIDNYVEKVGADPILYLITENGKNVKF